METPEPDSLSVAIDNYECFYSDSSSSGSEDEPDGEWFGIHSCVDQRIRETLIDTLTDECWYDLETKQRLCEMCFHGISADNTCGLCWQCWVMDVGMVVPFDYRRNPVDSRWFYEKWRPDTLRKNHPFSIINCAACHLGTLRFHRIRTCCCKRIIIITGRRRLRSFYDRCQARLTIPT